MSTPERRSKPRLRGPDPVFTTLSFSERLKRLPTDVLKLFKSRPFAFTFVVLVVAYIAHKIIQ